MATTARISFQEEDGTVLSIHCHFNGYPSGVGKILLKEYSKEEYILKLMALGNLFMLGLKPSLISTSEIRAISNEEECVRDDYFLPRHQPALKFYSLRDFYNTSPRNDYNYIFKNGDWYL